MYVLSKGPGAAGEPSQYCSGIRNYWRYNMAQFQSRLEGCPSLYRGSLVFAVCRRSDNNNKRVIGHRLSFAGDHDLQFHFMRTTFSLLCVVSLQFDRRGESRDKFFMKFNIIFHFPRESLFTNIRNVCVRSVGVRL